MVAIVQMLKWSSKDRQGRSRFPFSCSTCNTAVVLAVVQLRSSPCHLRKGHLPEVNLSRPHSSHHSWLSWGQVGRSSCPRTFLLPNTYYPLGQSCGPLGPGYPVFPM